ncbi:hypothetical protein M422DRAFT_202279 [Sphaerobolus stellatus SS14]|nr:hypothetical protein M422DRAFT_202279 [Sphaerobolus stellatus SS14]
MDFASSNSSAPKPVDPNKALRIARSAAYPKEIWYLVVCVIFLASICHLSSVLWSIRTVRKNRPTSKQIDNPSSETLPGGRTTAKSSIRRLPLAIVNAFRIVAFRWTIPLGGTLRVNFVEIFTTVGYLVAILVWEFINTRNVTTHLNLDMNYWANRAGTIAASQTTLIVALAGKNNIVSLLTGVSYEKLNIVHRAVARVVLLSVWVHAWGRWKIGFTGTDNWDEYWLRGGAVAAGAWTLIVFSSVRPIRRVMYEVFYYSHTILAVIALFAAYFHMQQARPGLGVYVWPALFIWGLDRALRLCRMIFFNIPFLHRNISPSKLEILSSDAVRLTVSRRFISWHPGQSMFITLPDISSLPIESHPFTISSVDSKIGGNIGEKELVFIIRARDGFTARLRDVARDHSGKSVNVILDGPYGAPPNLASFETVILIAGGTGVTYTLPLFTDLVKRARENKAVCRRIVFIWSIRVLAQMRWVSSTLVQALLEAPTYLQIDIRVHVTSLGTDSIPAIEKISEKEAIEISEYDLAALPSTPTRSSSSVMNDSEVASTPELVKMRGVRVEKGRPDLKGILDEEISSSLGPVSVDVCGPHLLSDSVRSILASDVAGPGDILKGRPSVTLHVEKFGMA